LAGRAESGRWLQCHWQRLETLEGNNVSLVALRIQDLLNILILILIIQNRILYNFCHERCRYNMYNKPRQNERAEVIRVTKSLRLPPARALAEKRMATNSGAAIISWA